MESTWWNQASTATMNNDGTYLDCNDKVDSTGYYVYRKDGKRDGECWGMDFEKARRDYSGQGTCRTGSKPCKDSLISTCMCVLDFNTICSSFYAYKDPACIHSDTCRS